MSDAPKLEGFKDWFPLALRNIGAGEYAVFNKTGLRFIIIEGASIGEAVVNALNEHLALKAENTTLRSKLRALKSQLKHTSGLIDQAIQEIDETLST